LLRLVVLVTTAERNEIDTVAISILDGPPPSSTYVRFGLTNFSSERLCFEPYGYRVYDAAQGNRLVNLPETLRTNVVLDSGLSGVLAVESPPASEAWRMLFHVTPVQKARTQTSLGMWERSLSRRHEEVRGMRAASPVVRLFGAASNAVEITRRQREVIGDIFY
jgi:hypothetical protein